MHTVNMQRLPNQVKIYTNDSELHDEKTKSKSKLLFTVFMLAHFHSAISTLTVKIMKT